MRQMSKITTAVVISTAVIIVLIAYLLPIKSVEKTPIAEVEVEAKAQSTPQQSEGKRKKIVQYQAVQKTVPQSEPNSEPEEILEKVGFSKEALKAGNHKDLLSILNTVRSLKEKKSTPDVTEVKRWLTILYKDVLQWRLLEQLISEDEANSIAISYQGDQPKLDITLIAKGSPHLSVNYIRSLHQLIVDFEQANQKVISNNQVMNFASRALDLAKRRKELSDTYFKTQIKYKFRSSEMSLDEKISRAKELYGAGDTSLVKYSLGYFVALLEQDIQEEQAQKVRGLISEISN
jgi:hypothetical protein